MSVRNLEALFAPDAVAVIGVSAKPGNLGALVLRNLKLGGFAGPLWAVGRAGTVLDGHAVSTDIAALPGVPDLAVICTPAASVPGLIAELGAKGTRAAIVLSAGLRAAVPGGAPTLEQAMLDAARPHLLRILGPNCIGALVPGIGLNASFAPCSAKPGKLAFVTQSGALATAMLDWAGDQGIGFSHFISLGDSSDVDFGDVLDYLASEPSTRAILMYMESVKHARKFMSAARAAARNKPVILVKAGRAAEGARAAASHTGALAGSDAVFDAAVRRAGMLRVDTLEALFDAAETLAHVHAEHGDRLAIVTNGGGAGVLAVDALVKGGGKLAALAAPTLAALDGCLPPGWPHANPVDIIGDAPVERYRAALEILLAAPEVDAVLFMHAPTAVVAAADIASVCLPLMAAAGKPVLSCWLGGASVAAARRASADAGVARYDTPERAVGAWLQMVDYAASQRALQQLPAAIPSDRTIDQPLIRAMVAQALAEGHEWLGATRSLALLAAYGIAVIASETARDPQHAAQVAQRLGFPVALKILSPTITHKSDVGGVVLNLAGAEQVERAAAEMLQRVALARPTAVIEGFTVQAMGRPAHAHELIVGGTTDPVFGPVVLFGEGGTGVELRARHAVALPPLNAELARDLVARSGLAIELAGYRGAPSVDQPALLRTIENVAQLMADLPAVAELDINPLLAHPLGVLAVDARIRLRQTLPGEASHLAICPYPNGLEEQLVLDGQRLLLRPIKPEDGQRLAAFYAGASAQDLRLRFFMARKSVPHSELARYCQIDYDREMAFIALASAVGDSAPQMVGEVRASCDPDNVRAEFAIQIASSWQGRGLGHALMQKLLRYLRQRGTATVSGEFLRENAAMAALARHAGFQVEHGNASSTSTMRLDLQAVA